MTPEARNPLALFTQPCKLETSSLDVTGLDLLCVANWEFCLSNSYWKDSILVSVFEGIGGRENICIKLKPAELNNRIEVIFN